MKKGLFQIIHKVCTVLYTYFYFVIIFSFSVRARKLERRNAKILAAQKPPQLVAALLCVPPKQTWGC